MYTGLRMTYTGGKKEMNSAFTVSAPSTLSSRVSLNKFYTCGWNLQERAGKLSDSSCLLPFYILQEDKTSRRLGIFKNMRIRERTRKELSVYSIIAPNSWSVDLQQSTDC